MSQPAIVVGGVSLPESPAMGALADVPPSLTASPAVDGSSGGVVMDALALLTAALPQQQLLNQLRASVARRISQAELELGTAVHFLPGGRDAMAALMSTACEKFVADQMRKGDLDAMALLRFAESPAPAATSAAAAGEVSSPHHVLPTCKASPSGAPAAATASNVGGGGRTVEFRDAIDTPWKPLTEEVMAAAIDLLDPLNMQQFRFDDLLTTCTDIGALRAAADDAKEALPRLLSTPAAGVKCNSFRPLRLCRGRVAKAHREGRTVWLHDTVIVPDGIGSLFAIDVGIRAASAATSSVTAPSLGDRFLRGDGLTPLPLSIGGTVTDVVWVGAGVEAYVFSSAAALLAALDPKEARTLPNGSHDIHVASTPLTRSVQSLFWVDAISSPTANGRRTVGASAVILSGDRAGTFGTWVITRGKKTITPPRLLAEIPLRRPADGSPDTSPIKTIDFLSETMCAVACTMEGHISVISGFARLDLANGVAPLAVLYVFLAGGGGLKAACVTRSQHAVFAGAMDGTVEMWLLSRMPADEKSPPSSPRQSPAGAALSAGPLRMLPRDASAHHDAPVACVASCATLPMAVSSDTVGVMMVWNLVSFTVLQTFVMPTVPGSKVEPPRALLWSDDCTALFVTTKTAVNILRTSADGSMLAVRHAIASGTSAKEKEDFSNATASRMAADERITASATLLGAAVLCNREKVLIYSGGVQWQRGGRPHAFLPYPRGDDRTIAGPSTTFVSSFAVDDPDRGARLLFLGLTNSEVLVVNGVTGGVLRRFTRYFQLAVPVTSILFVRHAQCLAVFGASRGLIQGDMVTFPLRYMRDPKEPILPLGISRQCGNCAAFIPQSAVPRPQEPRFVAVCERETVTHQRRDGVQDAETFRTTLSFYDSTFVAQTGNVTFSSIFQHDVDAAEARERSGFDRRASSDSLRGDSSSPPPGATKELVSFDAVPASPEVVGIHAILPTPSKIHARRALHDQSKAGARLQPATTDQCVCVVDDCGFSVVRVHTVTRPTSLATAANNSAAKSFMRATAASAAAAGAAMSVMARARRRTQNGGAMEGASEKIPPGDLLVRVAVGTSKSAVTASATCFGPPQANRTLSADEGFGSISFMTRNRQPPRPSPSDEVSSADDHPVPPQYLLVGDDTGLLQVFELESVVEDFSGGPIATRKLAGKTGAGGIKMIIPQIISPPTVTGHSAADLDGRDVACAILCVMSDGTLLDVTLESLVAENGKASLSEPGSPVAASVSVPVTPGVRMGASRSPVAPMNAVASGMPQTRASASMEGLSPIIPPARRSAKEIFSSAIKSLAAAESRRAPASTMSPTKETVHVERVARSDDRRPSAATPFKYDMLGHDGNGDDDRQREAHALGQKERGKDFAAGRGTVSPSLALDRRHNIPEVGLGDRQWVVDQLNAMCGGGINIDIHTGVAKAPAEDPPARVTPSGIKIFYQHDPMCTWEAAEDFDPDEDRPTTSTALGPIRQAPNQLQLQQSQLERSGLVANEWGALDKRSPSMRLPSLTTSAQSALSEANVLLSRTRQAANDGLHRPSYMLVERVPTPQYSAHQLREAVSNRSRSAMSSNANSPTGR